MVTFLPGVIYADNTGTSTGNPLADAILQYGAIGAMLVALVWFAWSSIKRERDRADKAESARDAAEAKVERLNDAYRTEVVPVLARATEAVARVTEVGGRMTEVASRMADTLGDATAELRGRRRGGT